LAEETKEDNVIKTWKLYRIEREIPIGKEFQED
jgi:hypothetical protein